MIGLLALSAIALAAFVAIERTVRSPMVDFAFFRSRTSTGANLVGFLVTFGMFAQFFFITLYLQNVLHYSALQTGLRFLPATVVIIIMGPLAGRLTDRVGPRSLMTAGLLIVAGAMLIQSRLTIHTGYGLLLPGFILMGLGVGLVMSPMSTAAMNAVDRTKAGAASGVLSMSRMVGGSVGLAAMGALVTAVSTSKIDHGPPPASGVDPRTDRQRAWQRRGAVRRPPRPAGGRYDDAQRLRLGSLHRLEVGAIVMVAGAVLAWMLIERSPAKATLEPVVEPERLPSEERAAA